ncbi:hypothetical protein Tco_0148549, partial [Tanacetum coccineum]
TEILKKFGFSDAKTASTPMETHKPLLKDADCKDVDEHLYRSMIGSLMYLTYSRPDIMFAVNLNWAFSISKDSPFDLVAFTDSDYAGASLDRKSITGGCQFLGCFRSKIVKETLNIRFLKNAPNVTGNGPDWLFDVDSLTISMNYVPVVARNQTNGIAGTRDNIVAGQADKKKEPEQEYILIPICITDPLISLGPKDSEEDVGMKPTKVN